MKAKSFRSDILSSIVWALMVMLCLSSCITLSIRPPICEPVSFGYYDDIPYPVDTIISLSDEVIEWPIYPSDLIKYQEDCQLECKQPTFEGFINWIKAKK